MRQMYLDMTITHPSNPTSTAASKSVSFLMPTSPSATTPELTTPTTPHTVIKRKFEGIAWEASKMLQSWGLHGVIVESNQGQSTDYDLGFEINLPLAWFFGSHALRGQLSLRKSSLVSKTLTLRHPSYLTSMTGLIHFSKLAAPTISPPSEPCYAVARVGQQIRCCTA
jgi:hypothetical protein